MVQIRAVDLRTVGDLIEALEEYPLDTRVYLWDTDGFKEHDVCMLHVEELFGSPEFSGLSGVGLFNN